MALFFLFTLSTFFYFYLHNTSHAFKKNKTTQSFWKGAELGIATTTTMTMIVVAELASSWWLCWRRVGDPLICRVATQQHKNYTHCARDFALYTSTIKLCSQQNLSGEIIRHINMIFLVKRSRTREGFTVERSEISPEKWSRKSVTNSHHSHIKTHNGREKEKEDTN